ncbi:unnamed protein product, partial [Prorocentrum cordatum]
INGDLGTVRVKPASVMRLRQALLAVLRRGAASPRMLEVLLGHITWAMICIRETLCILSFVSAFKSQKGPGVRPLWAPVKFELWCVASTLPLWTSRMNSPWGPHVSASDASPVGAGACTRKEVGPRVAELGRQAERWRYRCISAVAARSNALGLGGAPDDFDITEGFLGSNPEGFCKGFNEIPEELMQVSSWVTVISRRHWSPFKNILEHEGDALCDAVRHATRDVALHHHRLLFLVDNLPLALAAGKGRGREPTLRRPLRRISALALATNLRCYVRWIPSGLNVADGPSRHGFFHGKSFEELFGGALSFLESSAVSDPARARYRCHALRFLEWLGWHELDFTTASQLGSVLVYFLTDSALDGFDAATGRMTVAALRQFLPHILVGKRPLPRSARALDGWRRLVPPQMRLPLPRSAAMAVAGWLIWMNLPSMAVCVALAFHAYLGPSEAHRLRVGSLAPPIPGSGFDAGGIIVNDAKSGRHGKTGVMGESVLVDAPELWPAPRALTLNAPADASPWNFRPADARAMFRRALRELGLQKESPSSCALRQGGASRVLLSGDRTIAEAKERGRWLSDKSLRRHGKRTRLQQRMRDLPPQIAEFGEQAFARLSELIEIKCVKGSFPLPVPLQLAPALPRVAKR